MHLVLSCAPSLNGTALSLLPALQMPGAVNSWRVFGACLASAGDDFVERRAVRLCH